ncbi:hypothetical protein J6TS1_03170 [Siminovitchia terrae]|uniref:Ribosomal protein L32 n=1 Tax=Siminovitchia terrae TaxID=1914933 RepID=A0ABQ4KT40_SIMTE|nr:hypothetical protein J6TS1_03170 [Siminovitchia terrae]
MAKDKKEKLNHFFMSKKGVFNEKSKKLKNTVRFNKDESIFICPRCKNSVNVVMS